MQNLSPAQIWNIASEVWHNENVSNEYLRFLSEIIGSGDKSIFDAACGTGFPAIMLAKNGFKDITCSDGDAEEIEIFRSKLKKEGMSLEVMHARWQDLPEKISRKFDVLLNIGSSIMYLDSWDGEGIDGNRWHERISFIVKIFFSLLNEDGICILGIPETNRKDVTIKIIDMGRKEMDGKDVHVLWHVNIDWNKRVRKWKNEIIFGDENFSRTLESYAITKEELQEIVLEAGFKKAVFVEADGIYDSIIVGYK